MRCATSTRCELTSTRSAGGDLDHPRRRVKAGWFRLIPSRFPPVELYERLGDDGVQAAAKASEALTNPRLISAERLGAVTGGGPASPKMQNWNHAPFAYKNPQGSHLLGSAFGVLELLKDKRDAIAHALLRRERFLAATAERPTMLDMRLLITPVDGLFDDLTGLDPGMEPEARRSIGQTLVEEGSVGAITLRPELPGARFLSVFDGVVLGPTVQGAHYRFVWDGARIKSVYDFESKTDEALPREALVGSSPESRVA